MYVFWGAYLQITMPCGMLCRYAGFFSPGLEGLERLERRIIATSDESLQRPGNEQNIPVFQVFCYFSCAPGLTQMQLSDPDMQDHASILHTVIIFKICMCMHVHVHITYNLHTVYV